MRWLSQAQKNDSRKLWEEVFAEDSESFLDYYYEEKTKDNGIIVMEEEGEIVSMVQLNPFSVFVRGKSYQIPYIVGVATKVEHRGKRKMRDLLVRCMKNLEDEKVPFTFLKPAAAAIYWPHDFRFMSRYPDNRFSAAAEKLTKVPATKEDFEVLPSFINMCLTEKYDVYVIRSKEYFARLQKEKHSDGGELMVLKDEAGHIVGCYHYWPGEEEGEIEIDEIITTREYDLADPVSGEPQMMARICNLTTFMRMLSAGAPVSLPFFVTDPILPENNGRFRLRGDEERVTWMKAETEQEAMEPAVEISIADMVEWTFGYSDTDTMVAEGKIRCTPEQVEELKKIQTLSKVYLNEAV